MAGFKETPRQKMIGMMYLVLTALLALNVSTDILNAFTIVNEGMVRTNRNFEAKNNQQYADFETQYQLNRAKVEPFYLKAKQAQKLSQTLIAQIQDVQNKVIGHTELGDANIRNFPFEFENKYGETVDTIIAEPRDLSLNWVEAKSDYDKPGNILLGSKEDGTGGEATKLKEAFAQYKKDILKLLSKEQADGIKLGLNTEGHFNPNAGIFQNWEMNTFYHTVLSADVVLLNKYIAEVMNIESEVVSILFSNIKADDLGFSKVVAAVIPNANIVISGEEYEAKVFVAAYSDTDTPIVMVKENLDTLFKKDYEGAITIDSISQGVNYYRVKTSGTGDFKYAGVIKVKKPDGSYLTRHFNSNYSVIQPTAAVSPDKMLVVYRGLPNPLTISAAGFTNDQIRLVSNGGGALQSKGNGHYVFKPSLGKAKEVIFRVVGTRKDGSTKSMGPFKFRIFPLPSPSIRLAGKAEGTIGKSVLLNSPFLSARLVKFLFEGVKYRVLSYTLTVSGPGVGTLQTKVNGTRIPPKVLSKLKKAGKGTLVSVSGVKVVGPDGKKSAPGVTLRIN